MSDERRWLIACALFVGGGINYFDRATLGVLAPLVAKDMNLNSASLGLVFGVFFIGYALSCMGGGLAADRFGPRKVIVVAMLLWSFCCGMHGAAIGLVSLLLVRFLFGVAEGPFMSSSSKIISNWFPINQRSTGIALAMSGTMLGGSIAGPVAGYLALAHGWRFAFAIIATIGVIWAGWFMAIAKDRPAHTLTDSSGGRRGGSDAATSEVKSFVSYAISPAVLSTAIGYFGFNYLLYFFLSWFPSYLTIERHLSLRDMGFAASAPWVMGFLGYIGGGVATDAICRKTGQPLFARKIVLVTTLITAAACVAFSGQASSAGMAVISMSLAVFFLHLSANCYWAIVLDLVEAAHVGGVGGFVHMIANIAGIIAPIATGFIVQKTGSFVGAFFLAGAVALLGALSVSVFVPRNARRSKVPQAHAGVRI